MFDVIPHLGGSIHSVAQAIDLFRDRFPAHAGPDLSLVTRTRDGLPVEDP
jgi:hypothetical protein